MDKTNNEEKPREREVVKIEIYKNQKDEFLGKIALLKIALEDIEFSKTFARNEEVKEYLGLIKDIADMVYMPSIDSETIVSIEDMKELKYVKKNGRIEYLDIDIQSELVGEVREFILGSDKITGVIKDHKRLAHLGYFICCMLKELVPTVVKSDQYRDSITKYFTNEMFPDTSLPREISNLFMYALSEKIYDGSYKFNDKITFRNKYVVYVEVYANIQHQFPELYLKNEEEGKDNQIKVLAGFILSFFKGYGIMNADEFANRKTSGKNTSYRRYLKQTMTRLLNTAKEKYGFDYENLNSQPPPFEGSGLDKLFS